MLFRSELNSDLTLLNHDLEHYNEQKTAAITENNQTDLTNLNNLITTKELAIVSTKNQIIAKQSEIDDLTDDVLSINSTVSIINNFTQTQSTKPL